MPGALFWRRPTLARPVAVLPSGLQRFTSVFEMGTGGATALLSPECGTALAVRCGPSDARAKPGLWVLRKVEVNRPSLISEEHDVQLSLANRKFKIFFGVVECISMFFGNK